MDNDFAFELLDEKVTSKAKQQVSCRHLRPRRDDVRQSDVLMLKQR